MTARGARLSGAAEALRRFVLRTAVTPLGRVWALAYRALARLVIALLTRGDRTAAAYARGGLARGDFLPGVSDVDLALVVAAPDRVRRRWRRLARAVPGLGLVIDTPRVYDPQELAELAGSSAFTCSRAAYVTDGGLVDRRRMLERPGLYGGISEWRHLVGPDRRPSTHTRDLQERRIAAWLELLYWWRWAFPVCADPGGPRTAPLCVKLVAEPARILLWLVHGERVSSREEALRAAMARMPEEEHAFRLALDLERALLRSPAPPLAEVLPALVRLSTRIADRLVAEVEAEGTTEVRLTGQPAATTPLLDWRNLVDPDDSLESFELLPGDPCDPATLATAIFAWRPHHQPALRAGDLMVFPAPTVEASRLRAIKCRVTDPVVFALAEGSRVARFPNVEGWSAEDTARRAVAENPGARSERFLESVRDGSPELALPEHASGGLLLA